MSARRWTGMLEGGLVLATALSLLAPGAAAAGPPAVSPPTESAPTVSAPAAIVDPTTGMELVFVKGGCYLMGNIFGDRDQDHPGIDLPVHEVCVGDFYIGRYEVTQGQWQAVQGDNPAAAVDDYCRDPHCPVGEMSFAEVDRFIARLNAKTSGARYRLPTEAEWEYAARSGGKAERFSGGNDGESVSWSASTSGPREQRPPPYMHPVGEKAPNGLGLHDMSGNVYELVSDYFDPAYYAHSPRDNPTGPATGTERVKRGGCATGNPANGRTFRRYATTDGDSGLGFRLVRTP